jgi:Bacterial regulatory protein, Fis family
MPNLVDHTGELQPLAQLLDSLGLTGEQRAAVLDACRSELLRVGGTGLGPAPGAPVLPLRVAERRHLLAALRHTGGKIYGREGAAKLLDLKPTTLQSKLKKHGINRLDAVGDEGSTESNSSEDVSSSSSRAPGSTTSMAAAPPAE